MFMPNFVAAHRSSKKKTALIQRGQVYREETPRKGIDAEAPNTPKIVCGAK